MIKTKKAPKPCDMLQRVLAKDKRRSTEHNFGIIPLISSSKVWPYGQWWLEICSQHCLKQMVADSLSSAVAEVKISSFVLKIRSLRGAMCEFDGTEDRI